MFEDETTQQIISISEIEDGDFILLEIEMQPIEDDCDLVDAYQFVLDRETACWLARELLNITGENIDPELSV